MKDILIKLDDNTEYILNITNETTTQQLIQQILLIKLLSSSSSSSTSISTSSSSSFNSSTSTSFHEIDPKNLCLSSISLISNQYITKFYSFDSKVFSNLGKEEKEEEEKENVLYYLISGFSNQKELFDIKMKKIHVFNEMMKLFSNEIHLLTNEQERFVYFSLSFLISVFIFIHHFILFLVLNL